MGRFLRISPWILHFDLDEFHVGLADRSLGDRSDFDEVGEVVSDDPFHALSRLEDVCGEESTHLLGGRGVPDLSVARGEDGGEDGRFLSGDGLRGLEGEGGEDDVDRHSGFCCGSEHGSPHKRFVCRESS